MAKKSVPMSAAKMPKPKMKTIKMEPDKDDKGKGKKC